MRPLGKNEPLRRGEEATAIWATGLRRLNPDRPIGGFHHDRWLAVVQDAWDLLSTWGEDAAALGWTSSDLFGVDPNAPAARFDRAGLAVILARGWVLDLMVDSASIRSRAGAALTFRKPARGGIPIWEIEP
jgi:hypothetical protein